MSFAEIISELPKLTREQREAILQRLSTFDDGLWVDGLVSVDDRKEIDWRLAEARRGEAAWSSWDEAKARIQRKLNPD